MIWSSLSPIWSFQKDFIWSLKLLHKFSTPRTVKIKCLSLILSVSYILWIKSQMRVRLSDHMPWGELRDNVPISKDIIKKVKPRMRYQYTIRRARSRPPKYLCCQGEIFKAGCINGEFQRKAVALSLKFSSVFKIKKLIPKNPAPNKKTAALDLDDNKSSKDENLPWCLNSI